MPVKGTLNFTARSPDRPIGSPPGTIQLSEELSNKIRIYQRAKHNNETITTNCELIQPPPKITHLSYEHENAKGTMKQSIERRNWIKPEDVKIRDHNQKVQHLFKWVDQVSSFHNEPMSEMEKFRLYVLMFPT